MKKTALLTTAFAVLALGVALAEDNTASGTSITNTASVTYDNPNSPGTDAPAVPSPTVTTTVRQVYGVTITPNGTSTTPAASNTRTGAAGSVVTYTYTVTNNSNGTDRIDLSTLQPTSGDDFDLTGVTLYLDNPSSGTPGAWDSGDAVITVGTGATDGISLTQNLSTTTTDSATVFVRGTIPAGATKDQTSLLDLQGESRGDGNTVLDDVNNYAKVTVITAVLSLAKTADKTQASPLEDITYTIKLSNTGTDAAKRVRINDPLNTNTTFVSVSATTTITVGGAITSNTVLYSVNGTTWSSTAPTSGVTSAGVWVAVDTNGDSTITVADLVPVGNDVITVTYVVKVK